MSVWVDGRTQQKLQTHSSKCRAAAVDPAEAKIRFDFCLETKLHKKTNMSMEAFFQTTGVFFYFFTLKDQSFEADLATRGKQAEKV